MLRIGLIFALLVCLSACVSAVSSGTTGNTKIIEASNPSTQPSQTNGTPARSVQLNQCASERGIEGKIIYPSGWFDRVSRAEIEDELLGGSKTKRINADAKPITAISFNHPSEALSPPIEAICEIKFDISRRGIPSHILAACSHEVFIDEAERAVLSARFHPVRVNGDIVRGINMVHAMKFCLPD